MTHTTTDAAEARALDIARKAAALVFDERTKKAGHPATAGMERYYAKVIRAGEGDGFDAVQSALIAVRLATAEAASGAGEREEWAFTPDTREAQAIAQLSEEQELSPRAVMRQALRLYQADFLRRKAGETVTWSGDEQRARDFAGPLASLPPATDPAMVERCAAIAADHADQNNDTSVGRAINATARSIARDIRALAAAPTIPATGEAIKAMVGRFLAWPLPADFHPDNGISATRPNYAEGVEWRPIGTNLLTAAQAEAMIRHLLGESEDAATIPATGAVSDATIPATGHAATEKTLSDVLDEARISLRVTDACLECNADDVQRWHDTIAWLESLA